MRVGEAKQYALANPIIFLIVLYYPEKSYGSTLLQQPLQHPSQHLGSCRQGRNNHRCCLHHILPALRRHPRDEWHGWITRQVPHKFPSPYPGHSTKLKTIVVLGILFASALIHFMVNRFSDFKDIMHLPFDEKSTVDSTPVSHLAIAGILVGFGTDLANGCTSGHGLCGMPRFSLRSFVAVLAFLSTAIATATLSIKSYIPEIEALKFPVLNAISVPP